MMKVLVVGPSPERSKGGMATVIKEIKNDSNLSENCSIEIFESFVDGSRIKRVLYSIFSFAKFCITKRDYDVYHIHAASRGSTFRKGYYVDTAKRWGKKVIFHIHGAQYVEFYDGLSEKKKKRVVSILKKSDCVIALSKEWKEKFDKMFGLTNCVVLENGIDTCSYEIARTLPEQNLKSFLMLGRMGQRKGTYDLIDAVSLAVKIDKELVFYLAGDGEVDNVKKIVREKNLENNIIVVGWADFFKKISLLQNVSTVILPSYNEGLPMAVLEGMASGKAIISTTVGAIPEVVEEDNGILVSPGDIKALSEAIIKCSSDIRMVQGMSENNIKKIQERYSSGAMHEKLKTIYQSVWGGVKHVCKAAISIFGGLYYALQWQMSSNRKSRSCVNTDNRDNKVIITLTSFPARIKTVHKTIYTVLNQENVKPDSIELWLAEEQFPNKERDLPKKLLDLRSLGLDICWCEDIGSYKKLIPAMRKHSDCVLVTIDDDVYYKKTFLKGLYDQYLLDNSCIYCNKATMFTIKDGAYRAYGGGKNFYKHPCYLNKLVGVGGVLYPPKSLDLEVFNTKVIGRLAPTNDDIWFWFMAIKNGVRVSVIPHNTPKPIEIFEHQKSPKLTEVNDSGEKLFWVQFNNLIEAYPEIDVTLRNEYASIV